jgi:cell division septum initiation protein DivIVA
MESTEESIAPRFANVVRGYDRMQVDDYVEHLHQWIEQADYRSRQSEAAAARATAEVEQLRRRLASSDAETLTATPESMKALGDRVGSIMQSSFQAAKELQGRAQDAALATAAAAEESAARILADATGRAEELARAAEELFVQAQEALAGANAAVAHQVEEARTRGSAEREEMLKQAHHEMRELARRAAAEEKQRRQQIDALEDHRRRVMEEIGLLHERLGSIGDGLSVPSPPPEPQPQAQPQPQPNPQPQLNPQPRAQQPGQQQQDPTPSSEAPADETQVVELPSAETPRRRKVASSSTR